MKGVIEKIRGEAPVTAELLALVLEKAKDPTTFGAFFIAVRDLMEAASQLEIPTEPPPLEKVRAALSSLNALEELGSGVPMYLEDPGMRVLLQGLAPELRKETVTARLRDLYGSLEKIASLESQNPILGNLYHTYRAEAENVMDILRPLAERRGGESRG